LVHEEIEERLFGDGRMMAGSGPDFVFRNAGSFVLDRPVLTVYFIGSQCSEPTVKGRDLQDNGPQKVFRQSVVTSVVGPG